MQPVPPEHTLDAYAGDINILGAALERNKYFPDPSMAQVRQMVTELAILPLGASGETVHSATGHCKTLLLYGCKDTGKTALAHAIANHTGRRFLQSLTPGNTDGKYPARRRPR